MNLLNILKDQVTGSLASKASGFLGESESNVTKALGGIFPTILGSVIDKGSSAEGAGDLMNMLKDQDGSVLDNIGDVFSGGAESVNGLMGSGEGMISGLLGDKLGGVTEMISKMSGMGSGSSSSLLKMAAPMLMGLIGKQVRSGGMDASGLMGMLAGQKEHVSAAMPSGMGSLLGLSSLGGIVDKVVGGASDLAGGAVDAGKKVVDGTVDAGKAVVGGAADAGKAVVDGAADLAGGAVDAGKKVVGGTVDAGKKVVGGAADAGKAVVGGTVDAGKKVVGGAADAGKAVIGGAADLAGDVGGAAVKTGGSILKWLIPVLLVLGLLGFFGLRTGCDTIDNAANTVSDTTGNVVSGAADAVGDVAEGAVDVAGDVAGAVGDVASGAVALTGDLLSGAFGVIDAAAKKTMDGISFVAGSAGDQFKKFIDGGFKGENKFTFSNLTFATGSAQITAESAKEVDNLAAILKAYTGVNVQISGHTDNTGDAAKNKMLSQMRADAVKARLIAQGVAANRISTVGMGQDQPKADNATEEGRKANRRIEIRVVK